MHDGGGNRERTVLALPLIIEGARARGFEFVPALPVNGKNESRCHAAARAERVLVRAPQLDQFRALRRHHDAASL